MSLCVREREREREREKEREKKRKKRRVYVSFMDLEKEYDWANRESLWQILRV